MQNHFRNFAADAWVQAAKNMGYPEILDSSDPTTVYALSNPKLPLITYSGMGQAIGNPLSETTEDAPIPQPTFAYLMAKVKFAGISQGRSAARSRN